MTIRRIDVIGAGAWGTALAMLARGNGLSVRLWAHDPKVAEAIATRRENTRYLEGVTLPDEIEATSDLGVMGDADAVLLVTPAQHARRICTQLAPTLADGTPVVICSKGIEQSSGLLLSEVVGEVMPGAELAVLSGPTFAREVAQGLPTAVTIAAARLSQAERIGQALGSARFRPYAASDVLGAEIGGAIKNVIAIACGITEGMRLGDNARAALITRGLAEMSRLATAKGADSSTLAGLSGLGDLVLTATSRQSRNYALGLAIGEGRRAADVLAERRTVAEGAYTAGAVTRLAAALNTDMPISAAIDTIVNGDADLGRTIESLLSRPFRREEE